MVEGESLNQLIKRLQHLHLEQERILLALESIALESITNIEPTTTTTDTVSVPVAVPVPVLPVPVPLPVPPVPTTVFHVGQRVYITNHINHVLVRHATEVDRTAIVTHFTTSYIAIRTINRYHTHQHPKNLRPNHVKWILIATSSNSQQSSQWQ
jgi:hypothetical protein